MRMSDYLSLGWDQLKRRIVVTALCAIGIAIGSASIIVALAFGESVTHYAQERMNFYMKADEITVYGNTGESGPNDFSQSDGVLTDAKIKVIQGLPHVHKAAIFDRIGYFSFVVDETKRGNFELTATDLSALPDFGYDLMQGKFADLDNTVILSYSATVNLFDERVARIQSMQQERNPQQNQVSYRNIKPISFPLYQKQLIMSPSMDSPAAQKIDIPVRVIGVLQKPENVPDYMLSNNPQAFISKTFAERIKNQLKGSSQYQERQLKIKVDHMDNSAKVEQLVQQLKLYPQSNSRYRESSQNEMTIVRLIFGGAGLFVLLIASISIVVAMTMSTYQRRRQIGIMKVLGANLGQIRNMFIVESSLLGLIGGFLGILLSYWVIWAINIVVMKVADEQDILFINLWILPVGLVFALLTGVLSGIYPAMKASRTDALTAIKRD